MSKDIDLLSNFLRFSGGVFDYFVLVRFSVAGIDLAHFPVV